MNAYELANYLDVGMFFDDKKCQMAIDMLVTQADKIKKFESIQKELTDEEIDKLKAEYTKLPQKPWSGIPMAHFDLYGFARAILKKASEK